MKYDTPAILFAGGKSSRMGRDKALLPFGKANSLAYYQYQRLQAWFKSVFLSTKEAKFDFDAPLIFDRYSEHSPLVGIISAFETLPDTSSIFVLSVDAPFVPQYVIYELLAQKKTPYDVLVSRCQGRIQPLCACYRRTFLPLAKEALQKGNHKLTALIEQAHTCYIDFDDTEIFLNLNHPQEYEEALKLISSDEGYSPPQASES